MRRILLAGTAGTLLAVLAADLAAPLAAGVLSGNCRAANQPAATLLVPYFEVDLDNPGGVNTMLAVNNAAARPAVARVVMWTDWGIPTLAFDVYLTGYDVQTLNLRDLFAGKLPLTGPAISPSGALSQPGGEFPGCDTHLVSIFEGAPRAEGTGPGGGIDAAGVAYLRAAHGGRPLPGTAPARCAASPRPSGGPEAGVVIGYVTVDSVSRCTGSTVATLENTPADAPYFAPRGSGLANDDNVLWGDAVVLDPRAGAAISQPAVAIVADPDFLRAGDYTFYGRYLGFDGRDERVPLSSLYHARFLDDPASATTTDLVVWRDNRQAQATAQPCGANPVWSPLGELQLLLFDEQENPTQVQHSNAFPLTTQRVRIGGTSIPAAQPFGWVLLDLWHANATHAQAWVGSWVTTAGRCRFGHEALRADDLCSFGP
ncbi:MAG TPA: hypothetical protein VHR45_01675 [Thermoanaerobaculia bacterium]|nr:hypothetical protein [Thermoanaerobaculia bacterium]